ncbi:MAG: hypothetical protein ACRDL3_13675 [Solirubrobacterales bacterium]
MELVLIALVLLAVIVFVTVPLRRPERDGAPEDPGIADLEARKEAKYREIRDAAMDREAGKITDQEWSRQDAELRREAIAILKQLDAAQARRPDR